MSATASSDIHTALLITGSDPYAPKDWQAIQPPIEQEGVSDYSMELP